MVAYIGIDLGTSACCVASYCDGEAQVILNEDESPTTPSYVAFSGNQRLIGSAALEQANENVGNTIYDAKRFIGRKFDDPDIADLIKSCTFEVVNEDNKPKFKLVCFGEEKILTPEQISAMLLTKLKEQAEKSLDLKISEAVITVPAYFNSEQREATLAAAKIAKLDVIRLIHEPTAAILAHGLDKNFEFEEKLILVFDLGGGTFDITIVKCKNEVFTVVKTTGDSALGGRDFDSRLMSFLEPEVAKQCGKGLPESKIAMMKLMENCKQAKHQLSSETNGKIDIPELINGNDFNETISRARFEAISDDLFKRIEKYVEEILEEAKLQPDNIDFVLLVGGSSKIPKIRESLKEKFGQQKVIYNGDPEQIVARGAAIQAALIKKSAELKSVVLKGLFFEADTNFLRDISYVENKS